MPELRDDFDQTREHIRDDAWPHTVEPLTGRKRIFRWGLL